MYQLIIILHVLFGLSIIGLVMMQQGKGADAGAAFGSGGGASGTVFGAQGAASFLSRATAVLAVLFFSSSLGLALYHGQQGERTDIMDTPVKGVQQDMPSVEGVAPVPSIESQQAEIPTLQSDATVNKLVEEVLEAPITKEAPEVIQQQQSFQEKTTEAFEKAKASSIETGQAIKETTAETMEKTQESSKKTGQAIEDSATSIIEKLAE